MRLTFILFMLTIAMSLVIWSAATGQRDPSFVPECADVKWSRICKGKSS